MINKEPMNLMESEEAYRESLEGGEERKRHNY